MKKRFAFFYLLKNDSINIQNAIPHHIGYWMNSNFEDIAGGPFTDRSGGLITFIAKDLKEAEGIVSRDPFVQKKVLEKYWVKEWLVE